MNRENALSYYDNFMEEIQESASDEIQSTYKVLGRAFDEYLNAIQKDMFQQAFRYGYEQGLRTANNTKTA